MDYILLGGEKTVCPKRVRLRTATAKGKNDYCIPSKQNTVPVKMRPSETVLTRYNI